MKENLLRRYTFVVFTLVLSVTAHARYSPPEVLLFGVFHFANPGQDVVRVDQIDVLTEENQAYLEGLAERICAFRPTAILLEFDPSREPEINAQLREYLAGAPLPGSNEIYQIGFRVARTCGISSVVGFDEQEVHWRGDSLFAYLEREEPELVRTVTEEIGRIVADEAAAHRERRLRELLVRANDPELDRINKDFYLLTNVAGAASNFAGADATARWWHRNFRMYSRIQKHATPGARVLVVGGQGHTAILRDLLAIDRRIVGHDVHPYL